ncbi:MAG TPA: hypothetical protein VJP87_11070 [Candidatus Acidoferrales bacterium]|nr:hypothetical protein [Candidatus Acidoferrales bacterium]
MNRRFLGVLFPAFLLLLAGCQKAADSPSAATDSGSAASSSAPSDSSASAKSAPAPAPALKPIVVPADTTIAVVTDEALSSKTATSGQTFSATVESPVEVDGRVIIPKGAHATGMVKDVKPAGRFKGGAALELTLTSITINGRKHDVQTSAPTLTHAGKGKRTAAMVGGGAGGGAAIGAIAGGGKGAAIGALIGAAAGTGGAAFTGKADVQVPAETGLSFKLVAPLELRR